jgi:hypothetical protein
MFKIDHHRGTGNIYKIVVPAISLDFVCPVCGSPPLEKYVLFIGAPRYQSHIERKWIALDHLPKRSRARRLVTGTTVPCKRAKEVHSKGL